MRRVAHAHCNQAPPHSPAVGKPGGNIGRNSTVLFTLELAAAMDPVRAARSTASPMALWLTEPRAAASTNVQPAHSRAASDECTTGKYSPELLVGGPEKLRPHRCSNTARAAMGTGTLSETAPSCETEGGGRPHGGKLM